MLAKKLSKCLISVLTLVFFSLPLMAAEPIRIMVIEPLSGPNGPVGLMAVDMFNYSAGIINDRGGVLGGRKIEIVTYDNAMSTEKALQGLRKAIDENIRFISQGMGSHITLALLKAVDKHNKRNPDQSILFLNNSSNAVRLTEEDCSFWHFRFTQNTKMNAVAYAAVIARMPEIQKIYLFNQNYTSGTSFQIEFKKQIQKLAPEKELVGDTLIPLGQTKDFTPYVAKLAASEADIVLTSAFGGDLIGFVKAINAAGLDIDVYTIFASIPQYIMAIGIENALNVRIKGLMETNDNDNSSPKRINDWIRGYEKQYKLTPFTTALKSVMDFFSAGLEKAGTDDPKAVAYAMEGLELDASNNNVRIMRADDHQLLTPLAVAQLSTKVEHKVLAWGNLLPVGWETFAWASTEDIALPTSCKMKRP